MTDTWFEFVAAQLVSHPLGTMLMLGSRGDALLGTLPRCAAKRIIRTEADPDRAQSAERRFQDCPTVTILPVAVGATAGIATLHRFNLAEAAALRAPTGLKSLFAGLRETGQIEIETCTTASLLKDVTLERDAAHLLVLGMPGEEMTVIEQLAASGDLQRFSHVITPLPSLALYEGASDGAAIRARLEQAGFRIESRDISDPDLSFAHLRRDTQYLDIIAERDRFAEGRDQAQQKAQSLQTEIATLRATLEATTAEHAALRETLETTQAERDTLKQGRDTATAEIERLKTVRDQIAAARDEAKDKTRTQESEIARLQQAVQTRTSELEKARSDLGACNQKLNEVSENLSGRNARVNELQRDFEQLKTKHEAVTKSNKSLEETLRTKQQRIEELDARIDKAREDLRRAEGQVDLIKDLFLNAGV